MLRNAFLAAACFSLASAAVSVMAADQSTSRSTNASPATSARSSTNGSPSGNASSNAGSVAGPAIVADTEMANADRDLAQRVVDALNQYDELRDSSITVSVRQGRVLLEGSVKSRLEADGAGRIANRFAGNGYVSNQLVVREG